MRKYLGFFHFKLPLLELAVLARPQDHTKPLMGRTRGSLAAWSAGMVCTQGHPHVATHLMLPTAHSSWAGKLLALQVPLTTELRMTGCQEEKGWQAGAQHEVSALTVAMTRETSASMCHSTKFPSCGALPASKLMTASERRGGGQSEV